MFRECFGSSGNIIPPYVVGGCFEARCFEESQKLDLSWKPSLKSAPARAELCRRRDRRSLASAFDLATMHDGTDHERTHHMDNGTRNDNRNGTS
jgi:hypothetical protein